MIAKKRNETDTDWFNNNIRCIEMKNKITDIEAEACLITT